MKNDRLFQIIYILLEKKTVTAVELAQKFEVSVRTIYRDIDTLSVNGIPIMTMQGKCGGISIMPGYRLDKSLLNKQEQEEILFSLQSIKATGEYNEQLLSKMSALFGRIEREWIEVDFSRWGRKKTDLGKFDKIKKAILQKDILDIEYAGSSGAISNRRIKPIRLIFKSMGWYLQGFCMQAEEYRTFKINRIISLETTEERFEEEFENVPAIEGENQINHLIKVKFKISESAAFRVYDEFVREDVKAMEDGSLMIDTTMPEDSWLYSYILSFGTELEILEPLELKEKMKKYMERLGKHYGI